MSGAYYQGPMLGTWVKLKTGTMVGRAVGFDLRTNEYIILVPPTKTRSAVRIRAAATNVIEA